MSEIREKYLVRERQVFISINDPYYNRLKSDILNSFPEYKKNSSFDLVSKFLKDNGLERVYWNYNPSDIKDVEDDMKVYEFEAHDKENEELFKMYAENPLIGQCLEFEDIAKKYIESVQHYFKVLIEERQLLTLPQKMKILLVILYYTRKWSEKEKLHKDDDKRLLKYIFKQFDVKRTSNKEALLYDFIESTLKSCGRLFIETKNFKEKLYISTLKLHALAPKRAWFDLYKCLFDFYANYHNLSKFNLAEYEKLISNMVKMIRDRLLSNEKKEEAKIEIHSKYYNFQESIVKLFIYRPKYVVYLIKAILNTICSNNIEKKLYTDVLYWEWRSLEHEKYKIPSKLESNRKGIKKPHILHPNYKLIRDDSDIAIFLVMSEFNTSFNKIKIADLVIYIDAIEKKRFHLKHYDGDSETILGEWEQNITSMIDDKKPYLQLSVKIICDDETIYDSKKRLNRHILIFENENEISQPEINKEYTLVTFGNINPETTNAKSINIYDKSFKAFDVIFNNGFSVMRANTLLIWDKNFSTNPYCDINPSCTNIHYKEKEKIYVITSPKSILTINFNSKDNITLYEIDLNDQLETNLISSSPEKNESAITYQILLSKLEQNKPYILKIYNRNKMKLLTEKCFIILDDIDIQFSKPIYYDVADYNDAIVKLVFGNLENKKSFSFNDNEVAFPIFNGEFIANVPKLNILGKSNKSWIKDRIYWHEELVNDDEWEKIFISFPNNLSAKLYIGENKREIKTETLGTFLLRKSILGLSSDIKLDLNILPLILYIYKESEQIAMYELGRIAFKECFEHDPQFKVEEGYLTWDFGGRYIGGSEDELIFINQEEKDNRIRLNFKDDNKILEISKLKAGILRFNIEKESIFSVEPIVLVSGVIKIYFDGEYCYVDESY